MRIKNKELWEEFVEKNQDFYGKGIIDFAREWAERMEAELIPGDDITEQIKRIAYKTERAADDEIGGITGYMYGAAVSTLSSCWVYGEQLRQWHNLDIQIGNEGELANESGTTLNPALLNIAIEKNEN